MSEYSEAVAEQSAMDVGLGRAEKLFKHRVEVALYSDRYPSAHVLGLRNLNGRQCKWRNEVLDPWMVENPDSWITKRRRKLQL